jgi:hypothetical protein
MYRRDLDHIPDLIATPDVDSNELHIHAFAAARTEPRRLFDRSILLTMLFHRPAKALQA